MGWVSGILRWFGLGNAGSSAETTGGLVCGTVTHSATVSGTVSLSNVVTGTVSLSNVVTGTATLEDC